MDRQFAALFSRSFGGVAGWELRHGYHHQHYLSIMAEGEQKKFRFILSEYATSIVTASFHTKRVCGENKSSFT